MQVIDDQAARITQLDLQRLLNNQLIFNRLEIIPNRVEVLEFHLT